MTTDDGDFQSIHIVRGKTDAPAFSREEWERRLTPHIDEPITESKDMQITRLTKKIAELEGEIADLKGKRK